MGKATGAMNLSPMAQAVLDLVRKRPGTSWVELCRLVEGAKGERFVFGGPNVVLWHGVSQDLIDAVNALRDAGLIELRASVPLVYMVDGEVLTLPLARRLPEVGYAEPHWLPTEFSVPQSRKGKAKGTPRGGRLVPSRGGAGPRVPRAGVNL